MARKRITVTQESSSGRNERFFDNYKRISMTRNQFIKQIESGNYDNYHIRTINGIKTPVSNPNKSKKQ